MKKSFKNWTRQELKKVFGVTQTDNFLALETWVAAKDVVLTNEDEAFLQNLLKKSLRYVDSWNETELREKFIIKILEWIDFEFEEYECHSFAERYISVNTKNITNSENITLYGFVDWFVATGYQFPETPFFFIHEYKSEGAKELDGRGQLLSTLLATSILNEDSEPVYGTFVQGRMWFFLAYKDSKFAETSAYDVLKIDDLRQVILILKQQKRIIQQRLQN